VQIVLQRALRDDVICCEVCGGPVTGERGVGWAWHHRRGRDERPDSHSAQNQLVVHGADNVTACHGRIHRNTSGEARAAGWLIPRNGINYDPLLMPVLIDDGTRWVLFGADGRYHDVPPAERDGAA
jgi:hypothetical protein